MFDLDDYVSWDTETLLVGATQVIPELVCSTFYGLQSKTEKILHWSPKKAHAEYLREMLNEKIIIGQTLGYFDLPVIAMYDPSLLPAIWEALKEGRVHCTMIREMLMNLSTSGHIDQSSETNAQRVGYSLADLVMNYLDIDITESKEDEGSARMLYHLVQDLPLDEWPDNFVSYALEDPKLTGKVYLMQEARRNKIIKDRGYDPLEPEVVRLRVMAHFALGLMTAQGVELDGARVKEVTKTFTEMYNEPRLVEPLVEAGFVIPAVPEMPYKKKTIAHIDTCPCSKNSEDYIKAPKDRKLHAETCGCPPKMKKAQKEKGSDNAVYDYLWQLAQTNPNVKLWASDSLVNLLKEENTQEVFLKGKCINVAAVVAKRRIDWEAERETYYATLAKAETVEGEEGVHVPDPPPSESWITERPQGWRVGKDKDWLAEYAPLDPLLEIYAERKTIEKIVTSYLPRLYWAEGYEQCPAFLDGETDRIAGKVPAKRVHFGFSPLKETGRTAGRGMTNGKQGRSQVFTLPSTNGQQVDPRIREVHVPEGFLATGVEYPDLSTYTGNVIWSIDYSAMELGTWAQKCFELFGYSVLKDKINAGIDTHAFLGAQIACTVDPWYTNACGSATDRDAVAKLFITMKGLGDPCGSPQFIEIWKKHLAAKQTDYVAPTLADFFKYYRTYGKPTGLGYPGGLGPATFIAFSKGTYGVEVDLEMAKTLRQVWMDTYPEAKPYLDFVNSAKDPFCAPEYVEVEGKIRERNWLTYTSPLGMRRAKVAYAPCANGMGLQTPGAEGALYGVCDVMEACTIGSLAGRVFPNNFIHDEQTGETKWAWAQTTRDIETMQRIMERDMMKITPDVTARTEACLMFRWNKYAEPVWQEILEDGETKKVLVPWAPKKEEA